MCRIGEPELKLADKFSVYMFHLAHTDIRKLRQCVVKDAVEHFDVYCITVSYLRKQTEPITDGSDILRVLNPNTSMCARKKNCAADVLQPTVQPVRLRRRRTLSQYFKVYTAQSKPFVTDENTFWCLKFCLSFVDRDVYREYLVSKVLPVIY